MRLLILDNYDSFTYNLVHLVEKCSSINFEIIQNDRITLDEAGRFDKILLSPGPGLPSEAGIMPELLQKFHKTKSILGICLGLQAIAECFNSPLVNLPSVTHGFADNIKITGPDPLFANCPMVFKGGRYHSWAIDPLKISAELQITAVSDNGEIMAARHLSYDVRGVQFHPESILSTHGDQIIGNWLSTNWRPFQ